MFQADGTAEMEEEEECISMFDEDRNVEFLSFDGYEIKHDRDVLVFRFSFCDAVRMAPELKIDLSRYRQLIAELALASPGPRKTYIRNRLRRMSRAVRAMGLVYAAWFYMRFYSPRIVIRAGPRMGPRELAFWREHIYLRSLGEFYFVNKLDFRDGVEVVWEGVGDDESESESEDGHVGDVVGGYAAANEAGERHQQAASLGHEREEGWWEETTKPKGVLVPLGGGKDSLLAFEILKKTGVPLMWFYMGERYGEFERNWRLSAIIGASAEPSDDQPNATTEGPYRPRQGPARRRVSPRPAAAVPYATLEGLRELEFSDKLWNSDWRAHIAPQCPPWAAMVAFSSVLVALLNDLEFIAVGNEKSANFGNTAYLGMEINHQYDKSLEFERECNRYIREHIADDVYYFSVLQPLWEVDIMRRFLRRGSNSRRNYLHLFISCNFPLEKEGSRWCANCPKCCFVFLLLSAFLPPREVWAVFGDNLLERESLFVMFDELLGRQGRMKPFECVGTDDEVRQCLVLTRRQYRRHMPLQPLPALFRHLNDEEEEDGGEEEEDSDDDEDEQHDRADERGYATHDVVGGEGEDRRRREETLIPRWCWPALFAPQRSK